MKNLRFITTAITCTMGIGLIGGIAGIGHISTIPKSNNQVLLTSRTQQKLSGQKAIDYIQNHYLTQNANGTFSISKEASQTINSQTLLKLKQGMNSINAQILKGNLKFKLEKNNTGVKVINTYANKTEHSYVNENKQDKIVSNEYLQDDYIFLPSYFIDDDMYDITNTWYGGYGYVYSQDLPELYRIVNGWNSQWASTIWTAMDNGYTITLTYYGENASASIININY